MALIQQKEREIPDEGVLAKLVNDVRLVVFTQEMPVPVLQGDGRHLQGAGRDLPEGQGRGLRLRQGPDEGEGAEGRQDPGHRRDRREGLRRQVLRDTVRVRVLVARRRHHSTSPRARAACRQKSKDALKNLDQAVHIQVFVTPDVPVLPRRPCAWRTGSRSRAT